MKKKLFILIMAMVMALAMTACGGSSGGDDVEYTEDSYSEIEAVDLSVLPEDAELVPYEDFKTGFAMISQTGMDVPVVTMSDLESAFGVEGIYYEKSSYEQDGVAYKTYAWFSDEDWVDSKIAVAVIFKEDPETSELIYYMYTAQGITYEDVQ